MKLSYIVSALRIRFASSARRAELFRRRGAHIGTGCNLLVTSLGSEPYLVSIGDETVIAGNVDFVTHDAGTWVFRKEHPTSGRFGRIRIGSRVFIGVGAIILPGVTIGDGSIVGAGAVVTRDIPAGSVAAGVPARVISTVDDYKRRTLDHYPLLEEVAPGTTRSQSELRRQLEERYPL
jgi:acetyltransferase-like isoleucine patch superfamily enzyme